MTAGQSRRSLLCVLSPGWEKDRKRFSAGRGVGKERYGILLYEENFIVGHLFLFVFSAVARTCFVCSRTTVGRLACHQQRHK